MLVPFANLAAYLPRTPPVKSYSSLTPGLVVLAFFIDCSLATRCNSRGNDPDSVASFGVNDNHNRCRCDRPSSTNRCSEGEYSESMTVIESTSLNAETASSKLIPCLRRFNAALVGLHSNRTDHPYAASELSVPVSVPADRGQKQLGVRSGLLHRDRAVPGAVAAASLKLMWAAPSPRGQYAKSEAKRRSESKRQPRRNPRRWNRVKQLLVVGERRGSVGNHLGRPREVSAIEQRAHQEQWSAKTDRLPALVQRSAGIAGLDDDRRVGE